MVGRCPAIYLMGRMAIRHRLAAFHPKGCPLGSYGVLISLSGGCPPVPARFHTRYAPVRRSPASHCCDPLPLDLHVLGLSLAFILSQDQTLRCMTFVLFYSFRAPASPRAAPARLYSSYTKCASLPVFQCASASLASPLAGWLGSRGAKLWRFPVTCKSFFKSVLSDAPVVSESGCKGREKFGICKGKGE